MQAGTVTVLSSEGGLEDLKNVRMHKNISILQCPRFCIYSKRSLNLRTNSVEGNVQYKTECVYMHDNCDEEGKKTEIFSSWCALRR